MTSDKKDGKEIGDQFLNELEEVKKKLNIIRDVVDDVLKAAENGIKRLGGGKENE